MATNISTTVSSSMAVVPTPIGMPNLTGIASTFSNQLAWNKNTHACGRPAADLNLSVVCSLYNGKAGDDGLGLAFETYKDCCPVDVNRTNIWMAEYNCGVFCYTSNITLALAFNQCAMDTGRTAGNNTLMMGNCGYIDYVALKKGVSAGNKKSTVGVWGLMVGSLILTTAAMSF